MPKRQPIKFRPRFALTKPVQSPEQIAPKSEIERNVSKEHGSTVSQTRKSTTPQLRSKAKSARVDYLLPVELVDLIDVSWLELRKKEGRKLSKSEMIRRILSETLKDSRLGNSQAHEPQNP